jgi:hypothetical protein
MSRISRRDLLGRTAGLAVGATFGLPAFAAAAKPGTGIPNPIPGGFDENFNLVTSDPFIHLGPPAPGFEMSTITDFNGTVAAAEIRGLAIGSDDSNYSFDADMRFMEGTFVDTASRLRRGAFAFV